MADKVLKIKVEVCGRYLEFEIEDNEDRATAEEIIREAAKRLNHSAIRFRGQYKLKELDMELRMAALQQAAIAVEYEYNDRGSKVAKSLLETERVLEEHLESISGAIIDKIEI